MYGHDRKKVYVPCIFNAPFSPGPPDNRQGRPIDNTNQPMHTKTSILQGQPFTFHTIPLPSSPSFALPNLNPRSPRRLLVLPQTQQQLPKLLLPRSTPTPPRPLPTQIHQLRNPLPRRTARTRVLASLQELLCIPTRRRKRLLLLAIVVLVKIIDRCLRRLDRLLFFGGGGLGA